MPKLLIVASTGPQDPTRASIPFHIAANGAAPGGVESGIAFAGDAAELVAGALGKPLRPKSVHFVTDLPRTRNAKILRRVVRSVYTGADPGDLSSLENPSALAAISATRA